MAVTLKGKGVRWGVGMTGTIITTSLAQSGDMTYSSNTAELLDKDGIRVVFELRKEVRANTAHSSLSSFLPMA